MVGDQVHVLFGFLKFAKRAAFSVPSLRGANGSRERAPDDRLRDEAIQGAVHVVLDCFATLAMTIPPSCQLYITILYDQSGFT
jgi:hypothetical protein